MERIEEYGIIGNCRSAALVSRGGSIDWLCWPRFDSPSIFGAVLDDAAGRFCVAPVQPFRSSRSYVADTNVLQTRFETDGGSVVLTDLMPVAPDETAERALAPEHEILRVAKCERGEVELAIAFEPRPGYGRVQPRFRAAGQLGLRVDLGAELLVLRCDRPLPAPVDGCLRATVRLGQGETLALSLCYAGDWPAVLPPLGDRARLAIADSIGWWQQWAAGLRYDGPHREAVVRSALVLRMLFYAPSGAVVAAPTTSLPERIGGDLNWDYRFCWLRDASLTVRALFGLGCGDEARAFVSWLLHATRLTQPELRVLYDVFGKLPARERRLGHLRGHRGSQPVRTGNAADAQLQLDAYGEVIDAATHLARHGGALDHDTARMLRGLGQYVCEHYREPDEGLWEPRSGRRHHTHSRVLCWTALDRLLELHERGLLACADPDRMRRTRDLIADEIRTRAWNAELQSYVSELGGDELDASLLLLSWYGFEPAGSERMQRTYARIRERLSAGDALLYRYLPGGAVVEGAFGVCSFWGAEYLARGGGSVDDALHAFEQLCGHANDLGLYGEEIDPQSGAALGNFPQAFTHVGLINAALSLSERLQRERSTGSELRS